MQSFLAHLHKTHPHSREKKGRVEIKFPKLPAKLIFGDVISIYETDGGRGYDASRYVYFLRPFNPYP